MEEEISACPTLLVLRQEDGAVRPEKRISLRYATESRSWRYKANLPRKNKIALKEVKGKARQVEKIAVEKEKTEPSAQKKKRSKECYFDISKELHILSYHLFELRIIYCSKVWFVPDPEDSTY